MSEQYYYLLDGKEQGPFSRAAIEGLLKSGKLGGAFVRSGSDQPWQLPEEAGFKAEAISHVAAALASPAPPDPAAVVFRSQREIKESMSSGVGGTFAAAAVVLGLIGGGVWWMHRGDAEIKTYSSVGNERGVEIEGNDENQNTDLNTKDSPSIAEEQLNDAGFAHDQQQERCKSIQQEMLGERPSESQCAYSYDLSARALLIGCQQLSGILSQGEVIAGSPMVQRNIQRIERRMNRTAVSYLNIAQAKRCL